MNEEEFEKVKMRIRIEKERKDRERLEVMQRWDQIIGVVDVGGCPVPSLDSFTQLMDRVAVLERTGDGEQVASPPELRSVPWVISGNNPRLWLTGLVMLELLAKLEAGSDFDCVLAAQLAVKFTDSLLAELEKK